MQKNDTNNINEINDDKNNNKRINLIKTKIYIPDIECNSCVRRIEKKIKNIDGITDYKIHNDSMDINYDEKIVNENSLITAIEELGFRASTKPFGRKTFGERWKDFRENKHKYSTITKSIKYGALTFMILLLIQTVAYFGFFNSTIPNFLGEYASWLIYLDLSVASIGAVIWYMSSYKGNVTCMTGMMIGMTIAMQAGMMIGAVVGGTNGFFTGAMVGMTLAVVAGTLTGAVGGAMGAVQGMMSGIMAGTMGAMITVMMFGDRVSIFMPYYMILNILVLLGLIYIFFEEVVEGKSDVIEKTPDFVTLVSASIIITAVITLIMIYGPKSALFA